MVTHVPDGDYGAPVKYDPEFNGPTHRRSCTDIICLIIFAVFVVCWGFVCGFAFIRGDISRFLAPIDTDGQRCGFSNGLENRPYLVFFDISQCLTVDVPIYGCKTRQMCVSQCPSTNRIWQQIVETPTTDFDSIKSELICIPTVNVASITRDTLMGFIERDECARYNFQSNSVLNRCIGDIALIACTSTAASKDDPNNRQRSTLPATNARPKSLQDFFNFIEKGITSILESGKPIMTPNGGVCTKDFKGTKMINSKIKDYKVGAKIIEDLINLKWWILLALFVAMIVCMIYIAIMRWIAGPVVWFTLLAVIGLLSWSVYLCWVNYVYYRDQISEPETITTIGGMVESLGAQKETWIVLLILSSVSLLIVLIMLIFLRKRIVIAVALIKEGSKAVSSLKSTLFFPVFPWVIQILVLALAVSACFFLASIGEDTFQVNKVNVNEANCPYEHGQICFPSNFTTGTCNMTCVFTGVTNLPVVPWMQAWNAVGFLWVIFFIQGIGELILAGAFATWYWTFNKGDVPYFSLTYSITRSLFFNMGTVAFGSLIITICRIIRIAIEYVDQLCKKYDNFITKCLICCCRCFFACLESFLRFINRNAYIMCAVHGKGFCSSARKAFNLLMRNIIRVVVLDKVTDFLFFLSKLVVSIGCGAAAYYIFREPTVINTIQLSSMNYDIVPALIVGIVTYFIASMFFGVYSMAVDTLFLCFLEDLERNDGSPDRPYFMSKNLMKILGKKNK